LSHLYLFLIGFYVTSEIIFVSLSLTSHLSNTAWHENQIISLPLASVRAAESGN